MKRGMLQVVLILSMACLCTAGFLFRKCLVQRPFCEPNDALQKDNAPFTVHFLIPGGVYIDGKLKLISEKNQHLSKKAGDLFLFMIPKAEIL